MSADRPIRDLSMADLLAAWQAWNLSDFRDADPTVDPLAALAANHELARRLTGWQWHAVYAARRHGASWEQVGEALGCTGEQARAEFLDRIEAAEIWAPPFTDTAAYRAVLDDPTPPAALTMPGAAGEARP